MQEAVDALIRTCASVTWGITIAVDGTRSTAAGAGGALPTASMGKVFLLIEVARRIVDGTLDPDERLTAEPDERVGDSGLWQHLCEPDLAIGSLAALVGAVSDNTATNVLLRRVGLDRVRAVSVALGMPQTLLADRIRDVRGPADPPAPSFGRSDDLARLMAGLSSGTVESPEVSALVVGWLAADTDLSMVASAFALDPLAHADGVIRLFHKTGTDVGVRADAGHVEGPSGAVSYAVLAAWEPFADPILEAGHVGAVLQVMRGIGNLIHAQVS